VAKKKGPKPPDAKEVQCPDCGVSVTFVNERHGPMVAKTADRTAAWQAVKSYGWWGVCKKCGQTWHSEDHAPSMYVLRDTIEGRVKA